MKELIEKNKAEAIGFCIVLGLLAINHGKIMSNFSHGQELQSLAKAQQLESDLIKVRQDALLERAEIADQRYQDNAHLVLSLSHDGSFTAISEGLPVLKGEHADYYRLSIENGSEFDWRAVPASHYLPAGTIIADVYGTTAELVMNNGIPVAAYLARTGNQEIIEAAKERAAIQANVPNLLQ